MSQSAQCSGDEYARPVSPGAPAGVRAVQQVLAGKPAPTEPTVSAANTAAAAASEASS